MTPPFEIVERTSTLADLRREVAWRERPGSSVSPLGAVTVVERPVDPEGARS
jgi:hypothetical protein